MAPTALLPSQGGIGNLFGLGLVSWSRRKKPVVGNLGDESTFYYNEKLRMWVERGKEEEAMKSSSGLAPPPTSVASIGSAPSRRPITQRYVLQSNLTVCSASATSASAAALSASLIAASSTSSLPPAPLSASCAAPRSSPAGTLWPCGTASPSAGIENEGSQVSGGCMSTTASSSSTTRSSSRYSLATGCGSCGEEKESQSNFLAPGPLPGQGSPRSPRTSSASADAAEQQEPSPFCSPDGPPQQHSRQSSSCNMLPESSANFEEPIHVGAHGSEMGVSCQPSLAYWMPDAVKHDSQIEKLPYDEVPSCGFGSPLILSAPASPVPFPRVPSAGSSAASSDVGSDGHEAPHGDGSPDSCSSGRNSDAGAGSGTGLEAHHGSECNGGSYAHHFAYLHRYALQQGYGEADALAYAQYYAAHYGQQHQPHDEKQVEMMARTADAHDVPYPNRTLGGHDQAPCPAHAAVTDAPVAPAGPDSRDAVSAAVTALKQLRSSLPVAQPAAGGACPAPAQHSASDVQAVLSQVAQALSSAGLLNCGASGDCPSAIPSASKSASCSTPKEWQSSPAPCEARAEDAGVMAPSTPLLSAEPNQAAAYDVKRAKPLAPQPPPAHQAPAPRGSITAARTARDAELAALRRRLAAVLSERAALAEQAAVVRQQNVELGAQAEALRQWRAAQEGERAAARREAEAALAAERAAVADMAAQLAAERAEKARLAAQLEAERRTVAAVRSEGEERAGALARELEATRGSLCELQTEHDELLLCLGQESAKVAALSGVLEGSGVDPTPLLEEVEARYLVA